MKSIRTILGIVLMAVHPADAQVPPSIHSKLWGQNGEAWSPVSRLPDFSFAGYRRGEHPLPKLAPGVSVKEFGAIGDGDADDTEAFMKALKSVKAGAIEVPPGRYRISRRLEINRSGIVLRGAGPDKSILFFPHPLNDIVPSWGATTAGKRTSNYSWSGGYLALNGTFGSAVITEVTSPATRGAKFLTVSSAVKLKVGQEVEVYQSDLPDNSLAIELYSGDAGPVGKILGKSTTSLVSRITAIDDNRITLDRPLRCDLKLAWKPRLRAYRPSVTGSGVEDLGFEFPVTPYKGHFSELGFNPIALNGVADCWVRNIHIRNADSGPFISGVFNTLDGIVLESARSADSQQCTGHHGISLGGGDNLLVNFDIRTRFIHDITVSGCCAGNVCSSGRGVDLSLDHHSRSPYENLFTDLDAGGGTRLWNCGGGAALGKHCGTRGTFWNIRAEKPLKLPPADFGPATLNFVAIASDQPAETAMDGKWFESISPALIQPKNLHQAQRAKRMKAGK